MKMKAILLTIQSTSDIITNSSSEVFIINSENNTIKELISKVKNSNSALMHDIFYFENEEILKQFLIENFFNFDIMTTLSEVVDWNPIPSLTFDAMRGKEDYIKYDLNINEIVHSLLPVYRTLIGKIMVIIDNHYEMTNEVEALISNANNNNLIEYFDCI